MDCFKDFLGKDYESHIKCITEEERYSGKGFTAKEKKGEKKQNAWVEMLQSVLDEQKSAPQNVRRIIETISKHNNTPRKKPKFINFVKNVCGHKTNPKDIDQAWEFISVKLTDLSNVTQNQNKGNITSGEANKENGEQNKENGEQNKENDEQNKENNSQNDDADVKNVENPNGNDVGDLKKLSKKQRKEEKKRQKYEAELHSAEAPPVEDEIENEGKKGKKKKNRTESQNGDTVEATETKKQKKRKRQDTVNSLNGVPAVEVVADNIETKVPAEKTKKKKKKDEEAKEDASLCLHDQNVAKIEEVNAENNGKFNWHAVIMSVLQKKDNEVPFKRLQKKVLAEYSEATGQEIDDRIADKFIKKLKSAPNVRVDKNRVLLIE